MPLGDPRLRDMNDTQWLYEIECTNMQEEARYEELKDITKAIKMEVQSMLGLNINPVEDPKTGLLRLPDENEYTPLLMVTGPAEYLKSVGERIEQYRVQEQVHADLQSEVDGVPTSTTSGVSEQGAIGDIAYEDVTVEDLEAFMDEASSDAEFENTPEELERMEGWDSTSNRFMADHMVLSKEDLDEHEPDVQGFARTIGQFREYKKSERSKTSKEPDDLSVKIMSDDIDSASQPEVRRKHIVIDKDE